MEFSKHKTIPKRSRTMPKRGGRFVDAVRLLTGPTAVKSVSFPITETDSAISLRNSLGNAGRHCGIKITTITADGRVYAALREG